MSCSTLMLCCLPAQTLAPAAVALTEVPPAAAVLAAAVPAAAVLTAAAVICLQAAEEPLGELAIRALHCSGCAGQQ